MLWSTDGTQAGTVQVLDTGYDPYSGGVSRQTAAHGSLLVFMMGTKLWIAGPTPGPARLVADMGLVETNPMSGPAVAGGKVFFSSCSRLRRSLRATSANSSSSASRVEVCRRS